MKVTGQQVKRGIGVKVVKWVWLPTLMIVVAWVLSFFMDPPAALLAGSLGFLILFCFAFLGRIMTEEDFFG